jgi:TM2 domain-containing membrane protein YozV
VVIDRHGGRYAARSTARPPRRTATLPPLESLRRIRAEAEYADVRKDRRVAYALWCVVGIIGGHRFYLGDTGRAVAMLFTLGGLGLWTLADLFAVGRRVAAVNRARRAAAYARHGLVDPG